MELYFKLCYREFKVSLLQSLAFLRESIEYLVSSERFLHYWLYVTSVSYHCVISQVFFSSQTFNSCSLPRLTVLYHMHILVFGEILSGTLCRFLRRLLSTNILSQSINSSTPVTPNSDFYFFQAVRSLVSIWALFP